MSKIFEVRRTTRGADAVRGWGTQNSQIVADQLPPPPSTATFDRGEARSARFDLKSGRRIE